MKPLVERLAAFSRLNGKAAISPDLALRFEQAGTSTARARLAGELRSLVRTAAYADPVGPLPYAACLASPLSSLHAGAVFVLTVRRRRMAPPTMPKPPIIMTQLAGSGTGAIVVTVPFR